MSTLRYDDDAAAHTGASLPQAVSVSATGESFPAPLDDEDDFIVEGEGLEEQQARSTETAYG